MVSTGKRKDTFYLMFRTLFSLIKKKKEFKSSNLNLLLVTLTIEEGKQLSMTSPSKLKRHT